MLYLKETTGLTQSQAVENLNAVLGSDYFRKYDCDSARLSSDIITVDINRGFSLTEVLKVADITDTFGSLLNVALTRGTLREVVLGLRPTEVMLRDMQFEERLYEEGLELQLTVSAKREGTIENISYHFSVFNLGLKQSYFESQRLDFKSAQSKVKNWYGKLTRNLKKVLPHQ